MAKPQDSAHTLNVSDERLEVAVSWLRDSAPKLAGLGHEAQVMAALGLLICDDEGRISEAAMHSAWADSDAIDAAHMLLSAVKI